VSVVVAEGLGLRLGSRALFERLDFELGAHEFLAVLGPNGVGKTSLLRVLLGLFLLAKLVLQFDAQARSIRDLEGRTHPPIYAPIH
jgi:ABC-type transport system involved in cytochrome c biogenesis ATPase subunit